MKRVAGTKPLLLIGYGNPLRQDDGLGWRIAMAIEDLELPGLQVLAAQQLTHELAAPIALAEAVVFVDAAYGKSAANGSAQAIEPLALKPLHHKPQAPDPGPQTWSHQLTPQALLVLAGELYGHQPAALQLLVPARWNGHGEGFSPEAAAVLPRAMALLVGWAGGGCRRA
jgi:hydrogenase maturation protease